MDNVQRNIIRQSSIKSAIDFIKVRIEQGCTRDYKLSDTIEIADIIRKYCETGEMYNKNNNKLLK